MKYLLSLAHINGRLILASLKSYGGGQAAPESVPGWDKGSEQ